MVFGRLGKPQFLSVAFSKIGSQFLQEACGLPCRSAFSSCTNNAVNTYTNRSHTCGELRSSDVGKEVTLYGWLEYQRLDKFGVLRDGYGSVQFLVPDESKKIGDILGKLNLESVIKLRGIVTARPEGQSNKDMGTGDIEIIVQDLDVLNVAKANLPFHIREHAKAKESLRMKYRYLDLRYPKLQHNLRLRSKVIMKMREFLINECAFIEVETPTLFKKTPGGAREFVVPTHNKNQYYALVQSPQQLKQLLMVGAIDRYFQVARCYRDEGSRKDRQPEFTQLDLEFSFLEQEHIFPLIENLLVSSWPADLMPISVPFPRMKYTEAMERYGTDKPDVSFGSEVHNVTSIFANSSGESEVLTKKFGPESKNLNCHSVLFPQKAGHYTKAIQKKLDILAKESFPDVLYLPLPFNDSNTWSEKLKKIWPTLSPEKIAEELGCASGDLLFLAIGEKKSNLLLGQIRLEFAEALKKKNVDFGRHKSQFHFLWITDFPLFTKDEATGQIEASHHPFTAPHPDDLPLLLTDPLKVRGQHYDLVLNGAEIGGGSIRIHNHRLQRQVLEQILNIPTSSLEHLLDALHCGCPPHGGIALGLDRLLAIICGENSIRDVIAFPKSFESKDLMVGAPCDISVEDKIYYHQPNFQQEVKDSVPEDEVVQ